MSLPLYFQTTESTNDLILNYVDPDHLKAIYTFDQTNGRGQYGNRWEMLKDQNIAFSFIAPTSLIHIPDHLFNFYTALLLRRFISEKTGVQAQVKWPNDIILKGKKIVGVLLEKKKIEGVEYFVNGFGINILQDRFNDLSKGGSIKTQTGLSFDLHDFAKQFFAYLQEHLFQSISAKIVLQQLNEYLFRKNIISVFELKGAKINGIIKEVDSEGYLLVDLENRGLKRFFFKEITLLY